MALVKGPFTIKYGANQLEDVSEISWDYSSDSSNPTTIDGRTFDIPTTTSASIDVTLLGADITALGLIFPSYLVAAGGKMSTGETTTYDAFDCKAMSACGSVALKDDLEVIGCETTTRLVNASAKISSIDYEDNVVQTVTVTFTGNPTAGQAVFQLYKNDSLTSA
jgi:hypothetical protein